MACFTRIKPTIINDFAHLFIAHNFHLEIRNVVATVLCVLIDTHPVRVATVASKDLPLDQGTVFVEHPSFLNCQFHSDQIRSFSILLFALNVLLRDSVALVNLTSVDDFFQIWATQLQYPSISNQTTSLRSTLEDHSLSTFCTSTREPVLGKCCTIGMSTIFLRG